MIRRIVLDTSTLVSAALRPDSTPDQAVTYALTRAEVFCSPSTFHELETVPARPKFNVYVDAESRRRFVKIIRARSTEIEVSVELLTSVRGSCRDANDDQFLALALAANADAIVSSDKDLLALHPWRRIPVLNPAQFVRQFDK
jgi:putative PIN family toxin of toxin-antitoxin system